MARIILSRHLGKFVIIMNFCDSLRTVTRCVTKQHPVVEKSEFMVTPKTSKTLEAESDPLYILTLSLA